MMSGPATSREDGPRGGNGAPWLGWAFGVGGLLVLCSVYANASYAVTDRSDYRYFPPFRPGVNRNMNDHLGAEYFQIAKALRGGRGFADPFGDPTGPTAWMPPALPAALAGALWAFDDDQAAVTNAAIVFQVAVLVATAALCLALAAREPGCRVGVAVVVLAVHVVAAFWYCFQFTHDHGVVMLALDGVLAGLVWGRPLDAGRRAAAWGVAGGAAALVSPVVAFAWAVTTAAAAARTRRWGRLALALGVAAAVATPWTVRNYLTFGHFIPAKSNAWFELYQSQCLQPDGVLQSTSFPLHPYNRLGVEGREYRELGEMGFLAHKGEQFRAAVRADPGEYIRRVCQRAAAATLVYLPTDRTKEADRPWALWLSRLIHPLPFLAVVYLVWDSRRRTLTRAEWVVVGLYVAYLFPYFIVSYYERYTVPLLLLKVLLLTFAAARLGQADRPGRSPDSGAAVSSGQGALGHRAVLGWAACALAVWWSDPLSRATLPVAGRQGGVVLVPGFFGDWYAASEVAANRPAYSPPAAGLEAYLGVQAEGDAVVLGAAVPPPPRVALTLPFAWLEFPSAFAAWNLLTGAVFVGGMLLLAKRWWGFPTWAAPWALAALVLGHPLTYQLANAGTGFLTAGLLSVAWAVGADRRPRLTGTLVGLAAGLGVEAVFALVALAAGRQRAAVTGACTAVAVWAAGAVVVGMDGVADYLAALGATSIPAAADVSLTAAVRRLLGALGEPAPLWAVATPLVTGGAVVAAMAATRPHTTGGGVLGLSAALAAGTVFSPAVVPAHLLLLAPALLLSSRLTSSRIVGGTVAATVMVALPPADVIDFCFCLAGEDSVLRGAAELPPVIAAACRSSPCLGPVFLLWALYRSQPTGHPASVARTDHAAQIPR